MKPRQAHARLQAVITGQQGRSTAIEAHERNVLAITRAIHNLQARRKKLNAELAAVAGDLRARRRELRAVLQRDSSIGADDQRLDLAGQPDALDAADHRRER